MLGLLVLGWIVSTVDLKYEGGTRQEPVELKKSCDFLTYSLIYLDYLHDNFLKQARWNKGLGPSFL